MKKIFLLFVLMVICSCQATESEEVTFNIEMENSHAKIYELIFDETAPLGLEVGYSYFIKKSYANEKATKLMWDIKLIANRDWVNNKIKKMHLKKVLDGYPDFIKGRKQIQAHYAPKDSANYKCSGMVVTSIADDHKIPEKKNINEKYEIWMFRY